MIGGGALDCAIVWGMQRGGGGAPKRRRGLRILIFILVQRPRTKRISCKGQQWLTPLSLHPPSLLSFTGGPNAKHTRPWLAGTYPLRYPLQRCPLRYNPWRRYPLRYPLQRCSLRYNAWRRCRGGGLWEASAKACTAGCSLRYGA